MYVKGVQFKNAGELRSRNIIRGRGFGQPNFNNFRYYGFKAEITTMLCAMKSVAVANCEN